MKIDIAAAVGAVVREVASREHEGRMARVIVASRTYDTTVDDLWDALSNVERIPSWFLPISGDLRLGGRYQLQGNAGGEIKTCEPPRLLAVTWEFGGQVSWVTVRLSEAPQGGARLELEHMAHDDTRWNEFGPGAAGVGWELALIGLALHLATGTAVDPQAFMAWSGSPEGKELMRRISDAWGAAAIAAGTDAEAARAAASRTAAFYTGEAAPSA